MNLEPTEDQADLARLARSALAADDLPDARMVGPATAGDPTWQRLSELGVFGLGLPEEQGGAGLGIAEEVTVFEQFGAGLARGPVLSTVLGAHLALAAGRIAVLEEVLEGRRIALMHPYGDVGMDDAGAGSVSGQLVVIDGVDADMGLVVGPRAACLLSLDALTDRRLVHGTDRLSTTELARADAVRPIAVVRGSETWERGGLLVAAQLAGICRRTLELSVDHAKTRQQFGSPIGSFQAVKHRCADMAVRATAAEAQVRLAARAVQQSLPDAAQEVRAAKIVAGSAAEENAAANILNHGGMGFTAELGAHLYVRRAAALNVVFGHPAEHRRELVAAAV